MFPSIFTRHFGPLVGKVITILFLLHTLFSHVKGEVTVKSQGNSTVAVFFDLQIGSSASIPPDGILGRLVSAYPEDGCSPIQPPPNRTDLTYTLAWFVLVKRYACSFRQKVGIPHSLSVCHSLSLRPSEQVNNAIAAGYDGVIIYNTETPHASSTQGSAKELLKEPVNLTNSSGDGKDTFAFTHRNWLTPCVFDLGIPAVLISNEDGLTLKTYYLYDNNYFILITSELGHNMSIYPLPCTFCLLLFSAVVGLFVNFSYN